MRKLIIFLALASVLSSCSFLKPSTTEAQKILQTALANFISSTSYKSDLALKLATDTADPEINYVLNLQNQIDQSNPGKPQAQFHLNLAQKSTTENFVLELEGLRIADKSYLKFLQAPSLIDPELSAWQVLASQDLDSATASFLPNTGSGASFLSFTEPDPATQKQLASFLQEHELFEITQVYKNEELDSSKVYHFSALLDQKNWAAYLQEKNKLSKVQLGENSLAALQNSAEQTKLLAEFFIAKDSQRILKVIASLELGSEEQKLNGQLTLKLSYDEKLQLEAPTQSSEFIFPVGTPREDLYSEDTQALDSPACQQALRELQGLGNTASTELRNAKTAALRTACQENPESNP